MCIVCLEREIYKALLIIMHSATGAGNAMCLTFPFNRPTIFVKNTVGKTNILLMAHGAFIHWIDRKVRIKNAPFYQNGAFF